MDAEILKLKLDQLHSIQSAGITWWTSSCLLCAGIIAGVWRYRESLTTSPLLTSLRVAIGFFFLSIVVFGLLITLHLCILYSQVSHLAGGKDFTLDFAVTAISYLIATSSFVFASVAWFRLVSTFLKPRKRKPRIKPQNA